MKPRLQALRALRLKLAWLLIGWADRLVLSKYGASGQIPGKPLDEASDALRTAERLVAEQLDREEKA